jgi:hypothetical protein
MKEQNKQNINEATALQNKEVAATKVVAETELTDSELEDEELEGIAGGGSLRLGNLEREI